MIKISDDLMNYLNSTDKGAGQYVRIEIVTKNGTTYTINDEDLNGGSVKISKKSVSGNYFDIGECYINELSLTILDKGNKIRESLDNADVYVYYGVINDSLGINEEFQIGRFIIPTDTTIKKIASTSITGDSLLSKLDLPVYLTDYAGTPYELVYWSCENCGVELGISENDFNALSNNTNIKFYLSSESSIKSFRDIIMYVSQIIGGFATDTNDGKLTFKTYKDTNDTFNINNDTIASSNVGNSEYSINGISIPFEDKILYAGEGVNSDYLLELDSNPLFYSLSESTVQNILNNIWEQISVLKFRSFNFSYSGNPSIECGDLIYNENRNITGYITSTYWNYHNKSSVIGSFLDKRVNVQYQNIKKASTTGGSVDLKDLSSGLYNSEEFEREYYQQYKDVTNGWVSLLDLYNENKYMKQGTQYKEYVAGFGSNNTLYTVDLSDRINHTYGSNNYVSTLSNNALKEFRLEGNSLSEYINLSFDFGIKVDLDILNNIVGLKLPYLTYTDSDGVYHVSDSNTTVESVSIDFDARKAIQGSDYNKTTEKDCIGLITVIDEESLISLLYGSYVSDYTISNSNPIKTINGITYLLKNTLDFTDNESFYITIPRSYSFLGGSVLSGSSNNINVYNFTYGASLGDTGLKFCEIYRDLIFGRPNVTFNLSNGKSITLQFLARVCSVEADSIGFNGSLILTSEARGSKDPCCEALANSSDFSKILDYLYDSIQIRAVNVVAKFTSESSVGYKNKELVESINSKLEFSRFDSFKSYAEDKISSINININSIKNNITRINSSIESIENNVSDVQSSLQSNVESINSSINTINIDLSNLSDKVKEIEQIEISGGITLENWNDMKLDVNTLKDNVDNINTNISSINASLVLIEDKISNISVKHGSFNLFMSSDNYSHPLSSQLLGFTNVFNNASGDLSRFSFELISNIKAFSRFNKNKYTGDYCIKISEEGLYNFDLTITLANQFTGYIYPRIRVVKVYKDGTYSLSVPIDACCRYMANILLHGSVFLEFDDNTDYYYASVDFYANANANTFFSSGYASKLFISY